jgi:hypothetical protein
MVMAELVRDRASIVFKKLFWNGCFTAVADKQITKNKSDDNA